MNTNWRLTNSVVTDEEASNLNDMNNHKTSPIGVMVINQHTI